MIKNDHGRSNDNERSMYFGTLYNFRFDADQPPQSGSFSRSENAPIFPEFGQCQKWKVVRNLILQWP
jgi:hypothetical protein